jgi:hypothetical protein
MLPCSISHCVDRSTPVWSTDHPSRRRIELVGTIVTMTTIATIVLPWLSSSLLRHWRAARSGDQSLSTETGRNTNPRQHARNHERDPACPDRDSCQADCHRPVGQCTHKLQDRDDGEDCASKTRIAKRIQTQLPNYGRTGPSVYNAMFAICYSEYAFHGGARTLSALLVSERRNTPISEPKYQTVKHFVREVGAGAATAFIARTRSRVASDFRT